MSRSSDVGTLDCAQAREAIHVELDGDPLDEALRAALDRHLRVCGACADAREELGAVQQALRGIPALPMPDDDLQALLRRTSRPAIAGRRRPGFDWRVAAAAAALLMTVGGFWLLRPAPGPSEAELQRAAMEARLVLKMTAKALERAEQAAVRDVLEREVSPALRKMRVRLPSPVVRGDGREDT